MNVGGELESELMDSLTSFINLVVAGNVPTFARPFFFGATLIGLSKNDGGVRPIAIGCTLRRLAAKCCACLVKEEVGSRTLPHSVRFWYKPRGGGSRSFSEVFPFWYARG